MFMSPFQNASSARFTSGYGMRSGKLHAGIDYAAPKDTPLLAIDSGKITKIKTNGIDYGKRKLSELPANAISNANYIFLQCGEYVFFYTHLHEVRVKAGQTVNKGDIIGTVGSTGRSTGPHLHLEVKKNGALLNPVFAIDFNKFYTLQKNEMVKLPKPITIRTTNTAPMNFRTEPSTSARAHGYKVEPNLQFTVNELASGTSVNGIDTWYRIEYKGNAGYINGAYVEVLQQADTSGLEGTIKNLEAQLDIKAKELAAQKVQLEAEYNVAIEKLNSTIAASQSEHLNTVSALMTELKENNAEIEQLKEVAMRYNVAINIPAISSLTAEILEQELNVDGWLAKWGKWVDNKFKSSILKSLLKYDVFVLFGIGLVNVSVYAQNIQMQDWQQALLSGVVGVGLKLVTARYDTNKDGKLDKHDFTVYPK